MIKEVFTTSLRNTIDTKKLAYLNTNSILIINNKYTQQYTTLLKKYNYDWSTAITTSPGVISSAFLGAGDKHKRSIFKKKEKHVIKTLHRTYKNVLFKFLSKADKLVLIFRRQPQSLEVSNTIMRYIYLFMGLRVVYFITEPKVRYSYLKLRRYARIKRRLRKAVTKRLNEDISNTKLRFKNIEMLISKYHKN